jgi:hypothetical protein
VVPVPCRTKELVAESKDEDVLDHFFAQVVIDAVKLVLIPVWCKRALELAGAGEIFPERLFDLCNRG